MIAALTKLRARRDGLNDDKGFSLIELLVVVLILGILAAIAIPVFIGQQQQAEDASAKANLANAKVALISYAVTATSDTIPENLATSLQNYGWPQSGPPVTVASGDLSNFCITASGSKPFSVAHDGPIVEDSATCGAAAGDGD